MPSKIYEVMASGRPLLASAERNSDVWKIINETQCGICVEPEDADQLADAIMKLYEHPDLCEEMARRGRQFAEEKYSLNVIADQYNQLLLRIGNDSKSRLRR
jgi:colanic acid biosynthesis glycosyl transferase WcaI